MSRMGVDILFLLIVLKSLQLPMLGDASEGISMLEDAGT
jgi:hypothetical protein